jgi:hypothetical protein
MKSLLVYFGSYCKCAHKERHAGGLFWYSSSSEWVKCERSFRFCASAWLLLCVCCYFHYCTKEQAEDIVYTLLSPGSQRTLGGGIRPCALHLSLSFAYRSIIRGVHSKVLRDRKESLQHAELRLRVCTPSFLCTSTCASGDKSWWGFKNSPPSWKVICFVCWDGENHVFLIICAWLNSRVASSRWVGRRKLCELSQLVRYVM